jgi:hypothetical protein
MGRADDVIYYALAIVVAFLGIGVISMIVSIMVLAEMKWAEDDIRFHFRQTKLEKEPSGE